MREAEALFAGNREKYDFFRFSPAVRAGNFIFVSGVIGQTSEGTAYDHPQDEFRAAFRQIEAILEENDASLADVVSLDTFHVTGDLMDDISIFNEVRAAFMKAPHPAWTAVRVAGLAVSGARVEIRATAYVRRGK